MWSLSLALLAVRAAATLNIHPHPTMDMLNAFALDGWTPSPTQGPSMEMLGERLNYFEKRQATLSSGQLIGYFAPDSQCGYISGSIGASLPCSSNSRCAAIAPVGGNPGAVGCCPLGGSGCYFITTCYNLADLQSSRCDQGCQQDADVRICSASASPFCFGYTWAEISATIWGCAASSVTSKAPVSLNFVGANPTRTWSAAYYTPAGSSSNQLASAASSIRSASSAAQASSSASSTPAASSGSSTNIGAIVGGVVGGLAFLGLVAFGIIFFLLKKRKSKTDPAASAAATAPPNQPAGYGAPPGGPLHQQPVGAYGAAGYYSGHEPKQPISELATPDASPGASYLQPAAGAYGSSGKVEHANGGTTTPYMHDGSPVPPYPHAGFTPPQQQPPMELHGETSPNVHTQGGQPVFEAPAGTPGAKP